MFTGWLEHGMKNATDRARDLYMEILHDEWEPGIFLGE
jgi:hypothetical protein